MSNTYKVALALILGFLSTSPRAGDAASLSNERTEKFRQKTEQRIQQMDIWGRSTLQCPAPLGPLPDQGGEE